MSGETGAYAGEVEPATVLIVDDDPSVAELASKYLERTMDGVEACAETSPESALDRLVSGDAIDCVICDYKMPGIDGLELYERVSERRPDVPFILFTAAETDSLKERVTGRNICALIEKDGSSRTFDALTAQVKQEAL